MSILDDQIERLYKVKLKLEQIIQHPNRSLLDVIMIDYIISLRNSIDEELHFSNITKSIGKEDIIQEQIEHNAWRLMRSEPEATYFYNLINR